MAFGKKKGDSPAVAADLEADETPEIEDASDDAAAGDGAALDIAFPTIEEPPADDPAPEAPVAAGAPGADALLSMFQESKNAVDDLSVLVDLAGEADLDDILEELRTIRAALGITDAFDEEEDFAAAA